MTLYAIELWNRATEFEYSERIVEGPDAPAGTVPECVLRFARLLASIFGQGADAPTEMRVSYYVPTAVRDEGISHREETVTLYEEIT